MDFSLSEEQILLQDSVDKYVREHCDVERHRKLCKSELGYEAGAWQQFAELGWLSVPFSEALGGFDGGATDLMVMGEALGKGLVREPFLVTVVTCGGLLQRGGSDAQQRQYIPDIISGGAQWAFAFAEIQSGYDLGRVDTVAQRDGSGYRLTGRKLSVLNAHCADYLIVTARRSGQAGDGVGITLFIVDVNSPGVVRENFVAVDGSRGAHVQFTDVQLADEHVLGEAEDGLPLVEAGLDIAIVELGAEALGAMQALLDATVEYTKTRNQFGQPISKFQALQHRMAEMYLKVEETRSLVLNAAIALDEASDEAAAACAALKVKVSEAGRFVAQEAVQLHGGIGMTDELCVGHHYKRLMVLAKLYGDETYYLQKYAGLAASRAA
ncbi:MAG: acyl-CoA dehydrogenase family protein [Halioglobus sp.]|nr:acyl-CoA dehydrogenase family protein [Halioglobus sp.]